MDDSVQFFDEINDMMRLMTRECLTHALWPRAATRLTDSNNTRFCYSICTAAIVRVSVLLLVCIFNYLVDFNFTTKEFHFLYLSITENIFF